MTKRGRGATVGLVSLESTKELDVFTSDHSGYQYDDLLSLLVAEVDDS